MDALWEKKPTKPLWLRRRCNLAKFLLWNWSDEAGDREMFGSYAICLVTKLKWKHAGEMKGKWAFHIKTTYTEQRVQYVIHNICFAKLQV